MNPIENAGWTAIGAVLLAALSLPTAARAQAPADSAVVALDSLLVEALRVPTAATDAPFAVTVVEADRTRTARAGRGLAESLHGVPGLQASDRSNDALGERIVVRGSGARAQFGVRGVRVVIDGIPATLPDGQTDLSRLDMATIGRVEVLRGPASSLYGNASGGVLRISSAPPPDSPFAPRAEAMAGSDGLLRVHAGVGGRPGLVWYDASLTHRRLDGWRAHSSSEKSFVRVAGGLPLAGGDLTLQATGLTYDAENPGALAAATMAEDPRQAHIANVAQRTGESAQQGLAGATWLRALGPGSLEVAAYGTVRSLENPIPPAIIELRRAAGGIRAVYGLALSADRSPAAAPTLLFGAELDAQRDDRQNFENDAGEQGALTLDQLEGVRALGLFAHGRLPLGSRADASAGLRWDQFGFDVEDRLTAGDPDDSGERSMHALSPSLGLHARAHDALHLFANVATAFETPTTTELANRPDGAGGFNPELEPQRTLSLEAGARGAARALRYELTFWRAGIEDALLPFEVPSAPGRQFFRNAGSATHQGIEAGLALEWPRRVDWFVAYSRIDARFDEFTIDSTSFAGNRVPGIAPHRVEGGIAWQADRLMAGIDVTHSTEVPVDDANTLRADAWTVVDLRAEWRSLAGGASALRIFGGVRNLLDETYAGSVVVNAFGGRFFEPSPRRGFYLGVRAGAD